MSVYMLAERNALTRSRVLVVDDEPILCRMLERRLRQIGFEVDQAHDGDSAIPLAAKNAYDVAIVDYHMPGTHGLDVLAKIRTLQPSCMRVLMTGHGDFPIIVDAVNRGEIVRVLPKPFALEALEEAVEHAIAQSKRHAIISDETRERSALEHMFEECIERGHLRLAVQPIVAASPPHAGFAVECLLRSSHAVLNNPLLLLDAAERINKVGELGRIVNALAAEWAARLSEDMLLFVNVHPAQLGEDDVLESFAPLQPFAKRVVFELTERNLLSDVANWERAIATLTGAGYQFAVDDLGSGHNGLAMLADLQPAFIKVDMSIVRGVDREPRKQRLITLLADFAGATGAKLVAEGVETKQEADALLACGAQLLQGYFFGRPSFEV